MKKLIYFVICFFAMLCMSSCYDDSELRSQLADHENRIQSLETLCSQLNTNISALQSIVSALQQKDFVTNVSAIKEGNKEIGYTITFSNSESITIYHGQNGKNGQDGLNGNDGYSPIIGVRMFTDGQYYWTLDGEWLLNEDGNMIKASGEDGIAGDNGKDGEDGVSPQLKIVEDYWYVSYDNGQNWQQLYKAVGDDGDSFFKNISCTNTSLIITLLDGTTIELPIQNKNFDVIFENTKDILFSDGETLTIPFTIVGASDLICVECIGENGWTASAKILPDNSGEIYVTAPWYYTTGKVLVFITNGMEQVIMKCLTFESRTLSAVSNVYQISHMGGEIPIELFTNLEYDVIIPNDVASWISNIETKSTRCDTLHLMIEPNSDHYSRTTNIEILSKDKKISNIITITQLGIPQILSQNGTSNCYMVKPDSGLIYSFDASVKGNAHTNDLTGDVNVNLTNAQKVKLVWGVEKNGWYSTNNLRNLSYDAESKQISFSTYDYEGNALIALVNEDEDIIWSWHIWITNYIPEETQVTFIGGAVLQDRYLGSFSPDEIGLYYQWGRKDAFHSRTYNFEYTDITVATVQYSIEHPDVFMSPDYIGAENDWNVEHNSVWTSDKNIYDPCPLGWKVMDGNPFFISSWPEGYVAKFENNALCLTEPICTPNTTFRTTGMIHNGGGHIQGTTEYAGVWTNYGAYGDWYWARELQVRPDIRDEITDINLLYLYGAGRTVGQNVRCQKE